MLQKRSKPCKPKPTKEGCSCRSSRQSRTSEKPLAASTKKEDAKEVDSAILCTCTNLAWSSANFLDSTLVGAEVAVGQGTEAVQGEDPPALTTGKATGGAQVHIAGDRDEGRPLRNESGTAGEKKAENIEAVGVPGAQVLGKIKGKKVENTEAVGVPGAQVPGKIRGTKAKKEGPKSHDGIWNATREIDRCNKNVVAGIVDHQGWYVSSFYFKVPEHSHFLCVGHR